MVALFHHDRLKVNPPCYCLYIARCMSFKEAEWLLQGSTSQMLKACSKCCILLPEGLLALALMHVSMFGLFLSSGLDPAVLAGALFPMQLSDTTVADVKAARIAVQRKVDTGEYVQVSVEFSS